MTVNRWIIGLNLSYKGSYSKKIIQMLLKIINKMFLNFTCSFFLRLAFLMLFFSVFNVSAQEPAKPKLVVGLVVDQMRYDFLYRYYNKYGEGGFKRLLSKGYSCKNTNYTYVPTATAPGHAAIYTGTTPAINGIVGNDWFVRNLGKRIYCVEDTTVQVIGTTEGPKAGKMSPRNLLVTTVTDQLRLSNNKQSKVIGIALKERGAILPVGHMANAAYWYDTCGNWISSNYYMKQMPDWVNAFNAKNLPAAYLSKPWNTLLPIADYTESTADNVVYEEPFPRETSPVFPHNLPALKNQRFDLIRSTPFGNSLTADFARAAIENENLGQGKYTDFIAISFSSTDYIGHQFGPNSIETEDTYLRLDKDIEDFLNFLDLKLGKDGYLLFLTADHGVGSNPQFLAEHKMPGGFFSSQKMTAALKEFLNKTYGDGVYIANVINNQVYLHSRVFTEKNTSKEAAAEKCAAFILKLEGVSSTITAAEIRTHDYTTSPNILIKAGYNEKRSGDVIYTLLPGWMDYKKTGSNHGTAYSYDTHVPLIWFGWNIEPGESLVPVSISDIAPTVATLLKIEFPSGCTGVPIPGVAK
jgi:predicted AlkP superfamily pyrophosphatase or phosphodiesterase